MPIKLQDRFRNAWNAFKSRDPTEGYSSYFSPRNYSYEYDLGMSSGTRPDRIQMSRGLEKSIITSVYNRIAVDVSMVRIEHVRVNSSNYYKETINSKFNNALTLDANIDQTGQSLIQDAVMSMFDEGVVAIVPVDTDKDPDITDSYDILSMRVGQIREWFPQAVRINLYDERDGQKKDIIVPKRTVAIIENPFYAVMNEPNSTAQRLIRTLNDLDKVNNKTSSEKLDLIIKLPYSIRSDLKKREAEKRKAEIEDQIVNSRFGIAYIDQAENVIQLNRAVENNLWSQAQDLTDQLFNQLGMTKSIFNGTANDEEKVNYYNNTVSPILSVLSKELSRKFLTSTGRSQGQTVRYYQNPFGMIPVTQIGEIADKLTRNEILAPNEVRMELGYKPSEDEKANELRNRNINDNTNGTSAKITMDDAVNQSPVLNDPIDEIPPEEVPI